MKRDFTALGPDRLWVTDITYVPIQADWLRLAAIIDAFSRKVVGWAMDRHMRTELVESALRMAVSARKSAGVIHHSDQGCQYTSKPLRGCWGPPVHGRVGHLLRQRHGRELLRDPRL
ncbi:MAG: DDE-type integrase/transposase/recombinase [Alphaproteobacteria bacterium]|nr:DDE-type integrase/transposase/recombinase [Alphaproteobacteria bacterium]MCB9796533.1 DDE-type integrase/transposase/recombinase [Alphaproteobacteria bacterium]